MLKIYLYTPRAASKYFIKCPAVGLYLKIIFISSFGFLSVLQTKDAIFLKKLSILPKNRLSKSETCGTIIQLKIHTRFVRAPCSAKRNERRKNKKQVGEVNGGIYYGSYYNETALGSRRSFRSSDQKVEPQNAEVHLRRKKRHSHHRPSNFR